MQNPSTITILDGEALNPGDIDTTELKKLGKVIFYPRTQPEQIVERIGNSEIILINKIPLTKEIFDQCPNLKYIGICATGYNTVDIQEAKKRNIAVTNVPSYSTNAVAQQVFAFILSFTNKIAEHSKSVFNKEWVSSPNFCYWISPLTELAGKTLGIFGYGEIGKKVAELGKAFGMNIICATRTPSKIQANSGILPVDFTTLLQHSDFLTVHTPLTEETEEIFNECTLKNMKKKAILINTARGKLVDEEDLANALKNGIIAGYAADVVSEEPMKKNNPLLKAPNCIITPHIAWAALETRQRLMDKVIENIQAFQKGTLLNRIV